MRVLYAGAVPPIPGGISQHGGNLVEGLRSCGAEVRVESWASQYPRWLYPGSMDEQGEPLQGTTRRLHWSRPDSWVRVGHLARTADMIVVPWVNPVQAPAVGMLLRASAPSRRVVIVHNPLPHERGVLDEPLTRWALAPAELAVVHAQAVLPQLRELQPRIRSVVVRHPPNQPITRHAPGPRPPLRLLFLGYVRPYKGLDVAISAVARLVDEGFDVRLTVAGEFWEPVESWQREVERLGIARVVDLRDQYVPDDALDQLLADHHLVITPYRSATQSGILPLAHAAGRAVVASNVGGIGEAVRDGVNGVLVPPEDSAALAIGIRRAEALVDRFPKNFGTTWADVAEQLLEGVRALPHG